MKLHQFQELSVQDQLEYTIAHGVFLMALQDQEARIFLFDIDGFYVEVYFILETEGVGMINSFSEMERLARYLREMDLSTLIT